MAYIKGLTPRPANALKPPAPPAAANLQPGNNYPGGLFGSIGNGFAPAAQTHLTDATSGGGAGYGSYSLPPSNSVLQQYVNSMPGVMSANMNLNNQGGLADDQLRQLIQQAIISYGDPNVAKSLGVAVDPATAALAQGNTTAGHSQLAQLNLAASSSRDTMLSNLAANGILHSGELGFDQGIQSQKNSLAAYNAQQGVLNSISQANQQNLTTHTGLTDAVQNAILKATGQVNAHPNTYPIPQNNVTVGVNTPPTTPAAPKGPPLPSLPTQPSLKASPTVMRNSF